MNWPVTCKDLVGSSSLICVSLVLCFFYPPYWSEDFVLLCVTSSFWNCSVPVEISLYLPASRQERRWWYECLGKYYAQNIITVIRSTCVFSDSGSIWSCWNSPFFVCTTAWRINSRCRWNQPLPAVTSISPWLRYIYIGFASIIFGSKTDIT